MSPEDLREYYEERAAILEYDGGYTRKEAEKLARQEAQEKWNTKTTKS